MKRVMATLLSAAAWLMLCAIDAAGQDLSALREGDIVFSGCPAGQGAAVTAATGSPYTHCGIVFNHEGQLMVLEAVQPVRVTTLKAFLGGRHLAVIAARRLKARLKEDDIVKARKWAVAQIGRNYDTRFEWGDERLYCSELVWKVFEKGGVELCKPRRVRDYNLQSPEVRKLIQQRFGGMANLRLDEKIVAPSDLAASPLLEDVPLGNASIH